MEKIKLVFDKLDKFITNVGKKGAKNFTPKYLQGRLAGLNDIWNQIIDIHSHLLVACTAGKKGELQYFEDNLFATYEKKYEDIESTLLDNLDMLNESIAPPNDRRQAMRHR